MTMNAIATICLASAAMCGAAHDESSLLQFKGSAVPKADEECDWQCYLDRYDGLAKVCSKGTNMIGCAKRHWETHGKTEGRNCKCPGVEPLGGRGSSQTGGRGSSHTGGRGSSQSGGRGSSNTVIVDTLGHVGHGKATLTEALCTVLAKKYGGACHRRDTPTSQQPQGRIQIAASNVEYDTPNRHYVNYWYPSHTDTVKSMITGAYQFDGAILVVAATDGPMPQTREQVHLARQIGVPYIIVFLNSCDMVEDEELIEFAEMEVRELLSEFGFPGDDVPVIHGSASRALNGDEQWEGKIIELAEAMDTYIPEPERAENQPFLMPVEDVFESRGGIAVPGRIERGILETGVEVAIVGSKTSIVTCSGVEVNRYLVDEGVAGESVTALFGGVKRDEVERGQVLAAPGSIFPHTKFQAEVYFLSKEEGGPPSPLFHGYSLQFYFRTIGIQGTISLPEGVDLVMPGENIQVTIELITPVAMDDGQHFSILPVLGGSMLGVGVVAKIYYS